MPRMKQNDIVMLVEIAKLYYLEGETQEKISKRFNLSRSMISQLLTKARNMGIVEVKYTIHDPLASNEHYADELSRIFPGTVFNVLPLENDGKIDTVAHCAERCASYVNGELHDGSKIGISWGNTCYKFMNSYSADREFSDISIVPLIGEIELQHTHLQMNIMVKQLADKMNGQPSYIYAPAIAASKDERILYEQSSQLKETAAKWSDLDIAVVTAGIYSVDTDKYPVELTPENVKNYLSGTATNAGDCCCRCFTLDGKPILNDYNDRIIGIPLKDLKRTPKVVCIAAGKEKVFASYGVLKAGFTDVFFCDQTMAEDLLTLDKMMH